MKSLGLPQIGMRLSLQLVGLALALLVTPRSAGARDLWTDDMGDRYLSLNSSLKSVLLLSTPLYTPDASDGTNFWRMRLDLDSAITPWLTANVAYEQRVVLTTSTLGLGGGGAFLPPTGGLPYRVIPMGGAIIDEPQALYEHSLDRLAMSVRGDWGRVTLGRQAIGFGRSQFFTALDVLSPFGTFQVDQEWKAGVDALDAEWQASGKLALGFTASAESDFSDGAFLGRVQSTLGNADLVALGGKRSEDAMIGLAASAPLFDAEVHGEGAFFFTDGAGVTAPQIGDDIVIKGVLGGSYNFNVLSGLLLLAEYHFNGFGLSDIPSQQVALLDPDWQARFARGDFQTLGQHEIAANLSLTLNEVVRTYAYTVFSAQDGSGLGALGGTVDYSEHFSLDLSAFLPWGAPPTGSTLVPVLGSEYGASPFTVYLSMRFYD